MKFQTIPKKRLNKKFTYKLGDRIYVGVVHPKTKDFWIKNYSDECYITSFPLWLEGHPAYNNVIKNNPVIREGCRLAKLLLERKVQCC